MKTVTRLQIYEVNDEEIHGLDYPELTILSHWNYNDRVVIKTPDGKRFTIIADDLHKAIANAENH